MFKKKEKIVDENGLIVKKPIGMDTFICIIVGGVIIWYCSSVMGFGNFINSLMNSGLYMITDVILYIMALGGIMGALSAVLAEFGVIALINKLISPLMRPIYGLPGAASMGALATFMSDNPAIVSLSKEEKFIKYFKPYQIPLLCNFGCAWGMGMIVIPFLMSQKVDGAVTGALIGMLCAIIGSVISTRLMSMVTRKYYGVSKEEFKKDRSFKNDYVEEDRKVGASMFDRTFMTMLGGAKEGVKIGVEVLPAGLTIALIILMMVWGPGPNGYDGSACQGLGIFSQLGEYILPVTRFLFGFDNGADVTFPLTAIGTVGAALGLVPGMVADGTINANDIAVFAAIGMCWSGYMGNIAGMMEGLNSKQFTKPVIITHTIAGFLAGVIAHFIMLFIGL